VKRILFFSFLVGLVSLAYCAPVKADSFTLSGADSCGNGKTGCPDATYSFLITTTSATLTIKVLGDITAGVNNYIMGVDLGFAPANDLTGVKLSSVGGLSNSLGLWSTVDTGSLSNAGCGSNGGAFVCASSATPTPDGVPIIAGDTYSWTWTYNPISASDITDAGGVHVGANYDPHSGLIISTSINQEQVPEPTALSLLAAGLIGLAFISRRVLPANR
jgi:hypothetical protein